jgi:hypothetical protein
MDVLRPVTAPLKCSLFNSEYKFLFVAYMHVHVLGLAAWYIHKLSLGSQRLFFFLFIHCTRPYGLSILYQGLGKAFLGDIWLFLSDPSLFLFEFGLLGSTVVGAGTFS